jgi:hypothetical protein
LESDTGITLECGGEQTPLWNRVLMIFFGKCCWSPFWSAVAQNFGVRWRLDTALESSADDLFRNVLLVSLLECGGAKLWSAVAQNFGVRWRLDTALESSADDLFWNVLLVSLLECGGAKLWSAVVFRHRFGIEC